MLIPPNPADVSVEPGRREAQPLHVALVADGSPDSDAGAEIIRALPLPAGSQVTVLAAAAPNRPAEGVRPETVLHQAATRVQRAGVAVMSRLVPALTEAAFQDLPASPPLDLVVGAPAPPPGMAGKFVGVLPPWVPQAAIPVLEARAPFTGLRRLLLAYDGSPDSRAAVQFLTRLPLPPESVVTVLNVVTEVPSIRAMPAGGPNAPRLVQSLSLLKIREMPGAGQRRQARLLVRGAEQTLAEAGIRAESRVAWGEAATVILHEAAAVHADLVVVGSRGLSGVWNWLLGSVSRRLAREGRRSLLIVRGAQPAEPPLDGAAQPA